MRCTRCDREEYPFYYIPTPVSIVARNTRLGQWVCPSCLTDEEAGGPRARLLRILKTHRPKHTHTPTVTHEEVEWAEEAAKFRCPVNRSPQNCDGHACPRRQKPRCQYGSCEHPEMCMEISVTCFDDYYLNCIHFLEANALLAKVFAGEIRVVETDIKHVEWEASPL